MSIDNEQTDSCVYTNMYVRDSWPFTDNDKKMSVERTKEINDWQDRKKKIVVLLYTELGTFAIYSKRRQLRKKARKKN